jgi:hypothetical protein
MRSFALAFAAGLPLAAALPAAAHFQLDEPLVRYSNANGEVNKHCPCGAGTGNDRCTTGATVDDNRAVDRVTTFQPGETITLRWRETIGHTGRWRVAFSPSGADLDVFNDHILLDIADPSGSAGNTGAGNAWAVDVTLPSTPCDTCVLQVLQVMNGDTGTPVVDPRGDDLYFQCADIVIAGDVVGEGEGEGGEGEGEDGAEGEGEGDVDGGCAAAPAPLGAAVLLLLRRRLRRPMLRA